MGGESDELTESEYVAARSRNRQVRDRDWNEVDGKYSTFTCTFMYTHT